MGFRRSLAFLAVPFALVAIGCGAEPSSSSEQAEATQGGQTGSASCDQNPPDCLCDVIGGASIVRGRITTSLPGYVRITTTEVFGSHDPDLVSGSDVGGTFIVGQPCGVGHADPPEIGLDVFAAYEPGGEGCPAFDGCEAQCLRDASDDAASNACIAECRATLAEQCSEIRDEPLLRGLLQLMPWQDPLPITNQTPLSSEDFDVLLDVDDCRAHFASPEPFSCEGAF